MKKMMASTLCFLLSCMILTASAQTAIVQTGKGNLNLRARPDKHSAVLAYVPNGSEITLVEPTEDGWYRVTYRGKTGYVRAEYLVPADGDDTAVYTDEAVFAFVRKKPDEEAELVGVASYLTPITVLRVDGDWSYVSCQMKDGTALVGYIRSGEISQGRTAPTEESDYIELNVETRLTSKQRLYQWPDKRADSVATLPEDTPVLVKRVLGAWSYVIAGERHGYVRTEALETSAEPPAELPAPSETPTDTPPPSEPPSIPETSAPAITLPTATPAAEASAAPLAALEEESAVVATTASPPPQGEAINEATARGIADAALRQKYPAFSGATLRNVISQYCTEDATYETPYYQFDYFDESGAFLYSAMVHAYTQRVLYLFGGLPEEGKG